MTSRALLLAAALLAPPSLAPAQAQAPAPATAGSVDAADPRSVLEAIRAYGHKAKMTADDQGTPVIEVERGGINYSVYFFNCADAGGCLDLQFFSGFDVAEPLAADWANKWNRDWVAAKAEIGEEGDPGVSYFVTTQGGLSPANFEGVMEVWDLMLTQFTEDIGW